MNNYRKDKKKPGTRGPKSSAGRGQQRGRNSFRKKRRPEEHQSLRRFNRDDPPYHPEEYEPQIPKELLQKAAGKTREHLGRWQKDCDLLAKNQRKRGLLKISLDKWQAEAVQALQAGANVVVDAPTTAGKTLVVDTFVEEEIKQAGFRACYTCPVKSLSNDKLKEFREKYGKESVGIATGDIKENLDAPLVIATLESYRNSLLGVDPDLGRNLVIFDEYHFIQDNDRGSAWEEAIILTPPNCQMLLLSASLSNAGDFAAWLEFLTGRPTVLIQVTERPVPLVDMAWFNGHWYLGEALPEKAFPRQKSPYLEPLPLKNLARRLEQLIPLSLTPCIVYAGKRLSCELTAQAIMRQIPPLEAGEASVIGDRLQKADSETKVLSFMPQQLRRMLQTYGIAYHHSGLTPQVRMAVEELVKDGMLRFCVATMGLSLGINFSVKSTVISDAVRPGSQGFTPYSSSEVLQMTGRAGRRGKDPVGFSCWINTSFMTRYGGTDREAGYSRLKNDPTTFLGLVSRGFTPGKVEQFYRKSFLRFNNRSEKLTLVRKSRILKKFSVEEVPCDSPVAEYIACKNYQNATCYDCSLQKSCHKSIERWCSNPLAELQQHLHQIGALNSTDGLSPYGELARYFPQGGGLLLSSMIEREEINSGNLLAGAQLMGALSLACFKSPTVPDSYRLPFPPRAIEQDLTEFYPMELFPEYYDMPGRGGKRRRPGFREFNPAAGYIILKWAEGCTWKELTQEVCTEQFGAGDTTGLIYRTASWLQSLIQSPVGDLSRSARELREILLREPLQVSL